MLSRRELYRPLAFRLLGRRVVLEVVLVLLAIAAVVTATRPFLPLYSLLDSPVSWTSVPTGRLDILKLGVLVKQAPRRLGGWLGGQVKI